MVTVEASSLKDTRIDRGNVVCTTLVRPSRIPETDERTYLQQISLLKNKKHLNRSIMLLAASLRDGIVHLSILVFPLLG